ncbi:MAG: Uma2 family endonuclease [Roseiflexaceae bacterium]
MAIDTWAAQLRIVRPTDSLDLDLEPLQGLWSVEQYLKLTAQTNHLIEFTDGVIEVLPMPTKRHQAISLFLLLALLAFVRPRGAVFYAPLRLEVRPGKFREPDLLLVVDKDDPRAQDEFWLGADLVMEIVSPDRPKRDTEEKPLDYAEAGIPEYWIVNPLDETITVLTLEGDVYRPHGIFRRGDQATSVLLSGFSVAVNEVFDAQ